jgi:prepilin-type N-terminal cleavage/methylation domain-containing protein
MKNKKQYTAYKGFTLIELLVVISMISILSSMILISLSSAKERARDARRATELRSVEVALVAYETEHNGYPDCSDMGGCNFSSNSTDYAYNFNVLITYLKTNKYISDAAFTHKKTMGDNLWELIFRKALAASMSRSLNPSARPQDPLYVDRYYEYSASNCASGVCKYHRLKATMENVNFRGLDSSKKGAFGTDASGCTNTTSVGYYCLGTDSF